MEIQVSETRQRERGWVWATLFIAMGFFFIINFFYRGSAEIHPLLTGVGLLLLVPHAFRQPVRFTKPLWPQLKSPPRASRPIVWLAIAGIALIVAGLIVHWM